MASREKSTRSLSYVELLGLLDDACDALTELDIALADADGTAPAPRAQRLDRDLALRTIEPSFRAIEALASCYAPELPSVEAVLRVDGERVSVARLPEEALRALAPVHERSMDELRRSATPPVGDGRGHGVDAARQSNDVDESSGRFLLGT